jgi:hypothetical protein
MELMDFIVVAEDNKMLLSFDGEKWRAVSRKDYGYLFGDTTGALMPQGVAKTVGEAIMVADAENARMVTEKREAEQ